MDEAVNDGESAGYEVEQLPDALAFEVSVSETGGGSTLLAAGIGGTSRTTPTMIDDGDVFAEVAQVNLR